MQADKNVIVLREEDKQKLVRDGKSLVGDSSDFHSEQYESYIKDLSQTVTDKRIELTERERQLLQGINIQHTTSNDLKNKLSSILGELKNKNKVLSEITLKALNPQTDMRLDETGEESPSQSSKENLKNELKRSGGENTSSL